MASADGVVSTLRVGERVPQTSTALTLTTRELVQGERANAARPRLRTRT